MTPKGSQVAEADSEKTRGIQKRDEKGVREDKGRGQIGKEKAETQKNVLQGA